VLGPWERTVNWEKLVSTDLWLFLETKLIGHALQACDERGIEKPVIRLPEQTTGYHDMGAAKALAHTHNGRT